jgi:hypothetical protein
MSVRIRALAVTAGIALMAALGLAWSASAASLPTCAVTNTHCVSLPTTTSGAGLAGYYGAEDSQTRYRYVQTVTTASAHLADLNGQDSGGVGTELCDPNNGWGAQLGLVYYQGAYYVVYAYTGDNIGTGTFTTTAKADPCIQNGLINTDIAQAVSQQSILGSSNGGNVINQGDTILLQEFYNPWTASTHYHEVAFDACDLTTGVCRQGGGFYTHEPAPDGTEMREFGIGAVADGVTVTAPADLPADTFTSNEVTCYSCAHPVPVSSVYGIPDGTGGLTEAQWVNSNSQAVMSPNSDMTAAGDFTIYEGSTSP